MKVNDRSIENVNKIKQQMTEFEYTDKIVFCNGNIEDAASIIDNEGIDRNTWSPYDGRTSPPLPGELGIWVSYINIFKYIVENKIDRLLVIEDDASLSDHFVPELKICLNELPEDFDFLSLSYFSDQNNLTEGTDIGSDHVHRSLNQFSSAVGIIFSFQCAKKVLKLLRRFGIEYTNDCFIFHYSQKRMLNGFSLIKNDNPIIRHTNMVESVIDPNNNRNVENVL
jgi:GR25 family glycosyltransferase involved in LPS biosynthesis